MALQSTFKQFLAAPNTTFLTENASLHYITTLVTYNGSAEIIKHFNSQIRQLKKKEERFLDVIEGQNALAVEVESTMEFLTGGGAYLPGLDDNFLADRVVTFPIVCVSAVTDGNQNANSSFVCRSTSSVSMGTERSCRCDKTGIKAHFLS